MFGRTYESMYHGSMRGAGSPMFALWGYIISHQKPGADDDYYVELNEEELRDNIGEKIEVIQTVMALLQSPDKKSRTKKEEGRRLVKVGEYAYRVVNGAHYQRLADDQARRDYNKIKQREYRSKDKASSNGQTVSMTVNDTEADSVVQDCPRQVLDLSVSDSVPGKGAGEEVLLEFSSKLATGRLLAKWQVWMTHRRAHKKPKSWLLLFNEQIKWLEQFEEPVVFEILSASIRNGWQGLFEPVARGGKTEPHNARTPSVFELKEIVRVKEERAASLRHKHCSDCAGGETWDNAENRKTYFVLRKEIKELKSKIESFA